MKSIGMNIARFGLVIVLLWIGGMKFTAYEAEGIKWNLEDPPSTVAVIPVANRGLRREG